MRSAQLRRATLMQDGLSGRCRLGCGSASGRVVLSRVRDGSKYHVAQHELPSSRRMIWLSGNKRNSRCGRRNSQGSCWGSVATRPEPRWEGQPGDGLVTTRQKGAPSSRRNARALDTGPLILIAFPVHARRAFPRGAVVGALYQDTRGSGSGSSCARPLQERGRQESAFGEGAAKKVSV